MPPPSADLDKRQQSAAEDVAKDPACPISPNWQNTELRETGLLLPLLGRAQPSVDNSIPSSPAQKVSSPGKRPNINTAKVVPSLDVVASNAEVVPSLQVQYPELTSSTRGNSTGMSLSARCALLCERNSISLKDISGEFGETTALDIGCSTGGSSFELALSFSHVLGLDSDPMLVLAAKEMKESGVLEYHLSPGERPCYARVNPDVDRDRVRFWQYALPEMPPKLHVVDAVLVEAVEARKQPWLRRILEQVPGLLKSNGTCVVVLPWDGKTEGVGQGVTNSTGTSVQSSSAVAEVSIGIEAGESLGQQVGDHSGNTITATQVGELLGSLGMMFVAEERFEYPVQGGAGAEYAHAMVWHHV
jgi:SAM-dependent methyltransferase